jgi:hypothetical protein
MNIDNNSRISYGKGLTFRHSMEAFDEDSRRLLTFMKKWFYECRMAARSRYTYSSGSDRELYLSQDALEEFFTLFKDRTFTSYNNHNERTVFSEARPELVIDTEYKEDGALILKLKNYRDIYVGRTIYVLQITDENKNINNTISRYDSESSLIISPLLKAPIMNKGSLTFAEEDIPAFCMTVLPEIKNIITINDRKDNLKNYLPEEMTAHLYLDAPENNLITGRALAEYGQDILDLLSGDYVSLPDENTAPAATPAKPGTPHIRNTRNENKFLSAVGALMDFNQSSGFFVEGDDAVYKFLTEDIEKSGSLRQCI